MLMQSATAPQIAAVEATVREVAAKLSVMWDGSNWTDETAYLITASGNLQATGDNTGPSAIGSSVADTLSFTLNNTTGRFSQNRSDGALYSDISTDGGYGRKAKFEVGVKVGGSFVYWQIFVGFLKAPEEHSNPATVSYTCLGYMEKAGSKQVSTVLYQDKRADEYITALYALLVPTPTGLITECGFNCYPFLWADGEDIQTEMVDIAQADCGRVWFDQLGYLRYENYTHWLQHTSSVYTFTAARLSDLAPKTDWESFYNHVVVTWRPRAIAAYQEIWASSQVIEVQPGTTKTVWAKMTNPAYGISDPVAYTSGAGEGTYDYKARTGSYVDQTANMTVTIPAAGAANRYAQRVLVSLQNTSAVHVLYVDYLRLRGYPVLSTEEQTAEAYDDTYYTQHGERVLSIENVYLQEQDAAQSLADALLYRYKYPRVTCTIDGVPGFPYLEIGDRVTITETVTGIDRDFWVVGIDWTWQQGFKQSLTVIEIQDQTGSYRDWDYTDWFEVGTDDAHSTALGTVGRAF